MLARQLPTICGSRVQPMPVVASFCATRPRSGVSPARVDSGPSSDAHSKGPGSTLPQWERTSSDMGLPQRCCVAALRWVRSVKFWDTVMCRQRRFTPRSILTRCEHWLCHGREKPNEHTPTGCSGLHRDAARTGVQATRDRKGIDRFRYFLEANDTPYVTTDLALAWAKRPSHAQPAHWATRLGYVRGFARHPAAADPRNQIPPDGLLPFRPKRARPHLYSKEDIQRLLSAAL